MVERDVPEVLAAIVAGAFGPGATVTDCSQLKGGASALTYRATVAVPGEGEREVTVRAAGEWWGRERDRVRAEFALLRAVSAAGIPCPRPIALVEDADGAPMGIVSEYVEGAGHLPRSLPPAMTQQLASTLAAIHALPPGIVPAGIGASEGGAVAMPHWWRDTPEDPEAGDARARFAALPAVPLDARCLLHGDFWPGNVLFDEGRLVAVIDWEDALIGDPLQDLAIARLDLTWSSGLDARDAFTAAYARITGHPLATLAAWDLYAALRAAPGLEIWAEGYPAFGRDDITAPLMRTAVSASIHDSLRRLGA